MTNNETGRRILSFDREGKQNLERELNRMLRQGKEYHHEAILPTRAPRLHQMAKDCEKYLRNGHREVELAYFIGHQLVIRMLPEGRNSSGIEKVIVTKSWVNSSISN